MDGIPLMAEAATYCPNADCPYAKSYGEAASYRTDATTCSDCGSPLVVGSIPESPTPTVARSPRVSTPIGPALVKSAAASTGAILLGPALSLVPLPFVELDALRHAAPGPWAAGTSRVSLGAIGVMPWLSAFLIVEIAALIVPAWRPLRHGGPEDRRRLTRASTVLGVGIAFVQAMLLGRAIDTMRLYGDLAPQLDGPLAYTAFVLAAVAGSCLLRLAASGIERVGVGNGYSLLVLGQLLVWAETAPFSRRPADVDVLSLLLLVLGCAAIAAAVSRLVRPIAADDPRAVACPSSGFVPLSIAMGATAIVTSLMRAADPTAPARTTLPIPGAIGCIGLVPVLAALFSSPSRAAAAFAAAAGREVTEADLAGARSATARASGPTFALHVVLAGVWIAAAGIGLALPITLVALSTAIAKDLLAELRARRMHGDLESVWPLHRFDHVGLALAALRTEGIEPFARGANHRVLGHFFFPYVPIEIMVRRADRRRARDVLEALTRRWAQGRSEAIPADR
jgi:hypothetical protein